MFGKHGRATERKVNPNLEEYEHEQLEEEEPAREILSNTCAMADATKTTALHIDYITHSALSSVCHFISVKNYS